MFIPNERSDNMMKTISLSLRKLVTFPKFKMRQDFIRAIAEAEEDEKMGRTGTWEELIAEFEKDYGIKIRY